jgi:UDP-N-acetylmuramyl tripeptide synthase
VVEDVAVTVELRVPGLYNAYNALAALAGACSRGMDIKRAAAAVQEVRTAFGRAECVRVGGHDVWLLLVKNPTGCDEVLRLLAGLPAPLDLLAILNDNAADGRDISWIWDTAIEDVAGHLRRVTFAGTRAEDMALRFKYAGYSAADSPIIRDPLAALDAAVAATPAGAPLYVMTTYTAMLEVRRGLVGRGLLRHYLDEQAVGGRR